MKILFLDIESTGDDYKEHSLVQLSGIYLDSKGQEEFNYYLKPLSENSFQQQALEIIGMSMQELRDRGEENKIVFKKFLSFLDSKVKKFNKQDKIQMFAYNAKFDEDFLRQFFLDNDNDFYGAYFWNSIDILSIAANELIEERYKMKNFKLGTVAKYLGINFDENKIHDALEDARIAMKIYDKVMTQKHL